MFQQIENYFMAPRITARTMSLHPAVAFGSVLAGAGLFGAIGALIALPAAAVVQAMGSTYFEPPRGGRVPDDRRARAAPPLVPAGIGPPPDEPDDATPERGRRPDP